MTEDIVKAFQVVQNSPHSDGRPVVPGFCNVCGQWVRFAGAHPFRESFVCELCYSTSRYRRLASGILTYINHLVGCDSESLQSLPDTSAVRLKVLDTQSSFHSPPYACYSLPDRLSSYEWIEVVTTSYRPEKPWGSVLANGALNQNLEDLTFDSDSFDILLTSDVLEHVRLYRKAHSEIARVLRPGGAYVFTVPHTRNSLEHIVRVDTPDPDDASKDSFVLTPEYHGSADPNEGPVLSYRVFGSSLDDELTELGFNVNYTNEPNQRNAIYQTELFYCILI